MAIEQQVAEIEADAGKAIASASDEAALEAIRVAELGKKGRVSLLMRELLGCGKARGLQRIEGVVLKQNQGMLRLMEALGFAIENDPDDSEQMRVVRPLDTWPKA